MMFSVRKITEFTSEKIKKTKLDPKLSLQAVSTDRHVVEIVVEDLVKDERGFFKRDDINEWDKKSKKFVLIDKSDLTIDEVLLYIKKQFDINPKTTMKFYSEQLGYIDYAITDKVKKVYFQKTIDIGGKQVTIGPSTKFSEIAGVSNLVVKFSVKNDFDEYSGYKVARNQYSYVLKGTGNFERAFDTKEKAKIIHDFVEGIEGKWDGIENYAKKYLKENGLYPNALAMYKSVLRTNLLSQIETVYKNDALLNKIKAAIRNVGESDIIFEKYDKLINNVFETQFKTLTDKISNKDAKQFLEECAQQEIFNYILKTLDSDKKESLGGLSIYSLASKLDSFLSNPQKIKTFEDHFLQPSLISSSRAPLLKQIAGGYFDLAYQKIPQLTRNTGLLVGRQQESTDFFGGMPSRIVEAFIKNNFKIPKSFDGINYGSKNPPLGVNTHLGSKFDNLVNVEEVVLGVSNDWATVFKLFSTNTPSDRRYFDNLLIIFETLFLASPNKGSSNEDLTATTMKGMLNDFSSTQFATFFIEMAKGLKSGNFDLNRIRKFAGTLCGPSSNPDKNLELFINHLFLNRQKLDQFRMGSRGDDLKMPSKYTFLFAIAEWFGDRAELGKAKSKKDAIDAISEFFQSFDNEGHDNFKKFKEKIDSIAKKYYKSVYITSLSETNFYSALKGLFSNEKFLSQMIRRSESGVGFRLLWDDYVTPLFEAKVNNKPIKLTRNMIPTSINGKSVYILDSNKWVELTNLRNSYSFDAAHIFVYRLLENGEKEIGIVKIDSINNDFSKARDSVGNAIDIYEGFPTESDSIIHGAWLSNSENNLMLSDVKLEDFSVRSQEDQKWYEEFLEIENGELKNTLFMSYVIASGSKLTCFLQETGVNFKTYDAYNQFFPDINKDIIKSIRYIDEETIVKSENPSDGSKNKVSALQNIAFQISERGQGIGVPYVIMPTPVLNIELSEQKHSIKSFKYVFQSMKPEVGDALYDPSSPIFWVGLNLDKPQYDSQDPNYWVKMITRFTLNGDQKSLTNTKKKMFYNGLLLLIQNDLYIKVGENWVINPDSAFIKHEYLISESFTDNADFLKDETDPNPDNWKDDFDLVEKLDIVLQDKLGLVGSASLVSGFMTFSESHFPHKFHVDFVPHTYKDQNTLNSQFGLSQLDSKALLISNAHTISSFYSSFIINGFSHTLEGRIVTQSGSDDITIDQEVKPSTQAFLDDFFDVYKPRDYLDYRDATNLILEGYKSKIADQKGKNKAHFIGRDKFYNFLSKKVESAIETIFLPLPDAGYTQFDQFLENPEFWKSRTLKLAKNFLRAYIDEPSYKYDFIATLREILRTGNDGYINLKVASTGGKGISGTYQSNALLQEGLKIPISNEELVEFLSFDNLKELSIDAFFTLLFHSIHGTVSGMSPSGYSQDVDQWWSMKKEIVADKAIKAYNTIINSFTKENLGEELYNKKFTIKLVLDRGGGIAQSSYFLNKFSTFGFVDYRLSFCPNNPESLKDAIASMITYLYCFPDTFAVIKQGRLNFLFADIFNIHTPEYVATSIYTNTLAGTFLWSEDGSYNGLTRENYDTLIATYGNNFNDRDVRYLPGFDNEDIIGLLLNNFQTIFNEQVDEDIGIIDLRIKSLNSLVGDFPFVLSKYLYSDQSKALITELISQGIIENEVGLSAVTRDREGRIIRLEQGDFIHIIDRQRQKPIRFEIFAGLLTDAISIGNFIFDSITEYPCVDDTQPGYYPGAFFHIYEIRRGGATNYLHVLVDADGHIVTAFGKPYK